MKRILSSLFCVLTALAAMAQSEMTVNLENDKVKNYLDNVNYSYYTSTRISAYAKNLADDDERPCPVLFGLGDAAPANAFLLITNTDNEAETYTVAVEEGATAVTVYNLIPNQCYHFEAVSLSDGDETLLREAIVNTTGRVRMLYLPGLHNVRDLGGKVLADGSGTTQYGLIYRGSYFEGVAEESLEELHRLGVKAELDMRTIATPPTMSPLGEDVSYLFINMSDSWEGYVPRYNAELKQAYEYIVDNLRHRRPVYLHCVYGADRTGTLSALIESSVGVTLNDVYVDYEMSSFSAFVGKRDKNQINVRLLNGIGFKNGDDLTQRCCDYMVNEMGISQKDIDDLRAIMLGTYDYDDNGGTAAVQSVDGTSGSAVAVYDLTGRSIPQTTKGVTIVRHNGKVRKVLR